MYETTDLSDYNVSMSNKLVRAAHSLKLIEKRLIAAAMAKVDSRKGNLVHAHLSAFQKVRITAQEFADTYGIDQTNVYRELKEAADDLFNRYITIVEKKKYSKLRWLSSATYAENSGYVELSFTPEVYPHLHALSREYTTYKLKSTAALRSVYSWRLYELAKSWQDYCKAGKPFKMQLKDLQHSLEVPEKYTWHDTKKRALDPAIEEISQHAALKISYSVIKTGRSITALNISVAEISQMQLPL